MSAPLLVNHLSPAGEGVVRGEGEPLFVPFALPGETIRLDEAGALAEVLSPSPDRTEPFCPAFGRCGGCRMQHLSLAAYAAWKRETVQRALDRAGLAVEVGPTVIAHGRGRRRAIVHVRFGEGGPKAGFMAARSHDSRCSTPAPSSCRSSPTSSAWRARRRGRWPAATSRSTCR